jgi:hypothetical protein
MIDKAVYNLKVELMKIISEIQKTLDQKADQTQLWQVQVM